MADITYADETRLHPGDYPRKQNANAAPKTGDSPLFASEMAEMTPYYTQPKRDSSGAFIRVGVVAVLIGLGAAAAFNFADNTPPPAPAAIEEGTAVDTPVTPAPPALDAPAVEPAVEPAARPPFEERHPAPRRVVRAAPAPVTEEIPAPVTNFDATPAIPLPPPVAIEPAPPPPPAADMPNIATP